MHQSSALKQQLNLYYANEKYPFETLMRMITMNHVEISPQFRDLGLESLNFPMWKLFLRPTVDELVATMKRSRPLVFIWCVAAHSVERSERATDE